MAGPRRAASRKRHVAETTPTTTSTSFSLTVVLFSCIYNILLALSCAYLPDDPLYIGLSISVYAWAGSVLSVLGLIGIALKRPTLIISYAHFLFIDTLVSAICRLLILQFFIESFHDPSLCDSRSNTTIATWSPSNFRHDIVTSVKWQKENLAEEMNRGKRCRIAMDVVEFILMALLIGLMATQGALAMTMRKFAKELERSETKRVIVSVPEEDEKSSLTARYRDIESVKLSA